MDAYPGNIRDRYETWVIDR